MGDRVKKSALFDELARVGKALANGRRLELLDLLAQGERSVEHLATAAGLGLSTASAHLQVLRQAGLVTTRREGTRIHYGLAGQDVAALYERLRAVAGERTAGVERARVEYLGPDSEGPEGARAVGREELLSRWATGEVTVVDVRPAEEYSAAHIPGAVSMPLDELRDRLGELPADVEVVAYCRGAYCVFAYEAVALLRASGRTASRLQDGMLEWRLAGLPVEQGRAA
ncbi:MULTISPECIES: metalloregulator ArsR/SmtB family transcription factor [Micrococcaceae]|uniref:ArsR/SmtB family transcription factor n=1 Tax=Micrococcaceae TaxID=1268 RepID=UPI0016178FFB|nr:MULTISPECIES: metalloregulator ArsR/SmtB family transcription factor [Micrococcaceae]MBB5750620.1 rhodanese-related sulfurtransferase/DNA-binding transcriptional ArsR family regulator [Micrococcus sp. TA1]HRO31471.1 metalloregulator ArsR/SmtB family transcription factor [Citricoccus sp.]HRO95345.1 metalloregulator ArsR/SmtB family transcription factor [Citricoccus sp.]